MSGVWQASVWGCTLGFVAMALGAAGGTMGAGERGRPSRPRVSKVAQPSADQARAPGSDEALATKAAAFQAKLDAHFFDSDGYVLSALDERTLELRNAGKAYENSLMAMGSLLEAWCARHAVTGEAAVVQRARRLFDAMHGLVGTGGLRGWCPRPHQNDTSVDQMLYVAHAFDALINSGLADKGRRLKARQALADMAFYWREHGYLETRPDGSVDERAGDYRPGRTDHALMAGFQLLDAHHNRDAAARAAYEHILAAAGQTLRESWLARRQRERREYISHPYVAQLYALVLDLCVRYDRDRSAAWGAGLASWAGGHAEAFLVGHSLSASDEPADGLSFETIVYDPQTGRTHPPAPGEFTGRARGDAFHIAVTDLLAARPLDEPRYVATARKILAAYTDENMRWLYTSDPAQVAERFRGSLGLYNGYGLCTWLQAYWMLRRLAPPGESGAGDP